MPDDFTDRVHGYLERRDRRVQVPSIEWPRSTSRPIARMVALATVVAVFVAAAIVAGFAVLGPRSASPAPAYHGGVGTPPARSDAAIAYDPLTGEVVMFGGLGDNGSLGDTWIWNGADWTQEVLSPSPLSRTGASMVYDPKLHGLVLFGGAPNQPISASQQANLDATWLWTGSVWKRIDTPHDPTSNGLMGSVSLGAMAYDATTGRVVLVTSATGIHFIACSAETWTFDGSDWLLQKPATQLPAAVATVVDETQTGDVIAVLHARAAVAPAGFAGYFMRRRQHSGAGTPHVEHVALDRLELERGQLRIRAGRKCACARIEWNVSAAQPCFGCVDGVDRQQRGALVVERVALERGCWIRRWTLARARTACKASTVRGISFCTAASTSAQMPMTSTRGSGLVCAGSDPSGPHRRPQPHHRFPLQLRPPAPSRYRFLRILRKVSATFRPCKGRPSRRLP